MEKTATTQLSALTKTLMTYLLHVSSSVRNHAALARAEARQLRNPIRRIWRPASARVAFDFRLLVDARGEGRWRLGV